MINVRYALGEDRAFWFTEDRHITEFDFEQKVRDKQGYIICDGDKPIGIMRYNLFWDNIPFLNLIRVQEVYHKKGFGRAGMMYWESEMNALGYKFVLTSTQSDEQAQHFYRKIGYKECGSLMLDEEPLEIIFIKYL